ncbi:MAG: PP2C family protein-serine/threonine phosphatase [Terracidiphilus sp.]
MTAALFVGAAVPLLVQAQQTPRLILDVLNCSLAVAFLALWWAAPDYRVFRSLGIFYAIAFAIVLVESGGPTDFSWALRALVVAVMVEAAGEAMQVPHRGWTRWFWPVYAFAGIAAWFPSISFLRELLLLAEVPLGALIVQGFRRGNRRDQMIASAFSVYFLARLTLYGSVQKLTGIKEYATIGGWQWEYIACATILLGVATLAIFVRDLIHDRAEKQRLAAELAASRAVQQVLLAEEIAAVPGFDIRSVYAPHGEVGGDFFQIVPAVNGGALIVIGDVSGKGISAAMMVSWLVGTLRALTRTIASPAELLAGLNQCVQGRSHGGFTTCLILRVEPSGTVTTANAGHIQPYWNGEELLCENGLPLGLVAESNYRESTFQVSAGDQLTLVTDGVVEARNNIGDLFGFDRTRAISTQSAESIARAAQSFGQEDDITVLTLALTPAPVEAFNA